MRSGMRTQCMCTGLEMCVENCRYKLSPRLPVESLKELLPRLHDTFRNWCPCDFDVGIVGSLLYIHFPSVHVMQSMIPRILAISYPPMNPPPPKGQPARQEYVRSLFDGIAAHYDFLNHLLSLGFDILWRRRAIRLLQEFRPQFVLDVATGTADLAIEAARRLGAKVDGIDISDEMLTLGRTKVAERRLEQQVSLKRGNAESLDFENKTIDAVTVAFGVRNFANVRQGLAEMHRVLKQNGVALILEFSRPRIFPFRQIYGFYFRRILPFVGGLVSKNRESYDYLPRSVNEFPDDLAFIELLHSAGFGKTKQYRLTFGIVTIYLSTKQES